MKRIVLFAVCLSFAGWLAASAQTRTQPARRKAQIFLDVKETNLGQPSTVAINTLAERLAAAGFRVTTTRREAALIVDGTIASRSTTVTDDVKREGGVNAEASASVRLLAGDEVIATSVERSAPGDWGVQAERVGEDRLLEVAGRVAEELFSGDFAQEFAAPAGAGNSTVAASPARPAAQNKAIRKPARKPGVSFLEVASLVQNYTPEDRILAALRKYGIKFKPKDAALNQLRSLGASDAVISAVKSSNVV
ncbi:MAG: hypothetical protein SF339_11380 [Blastocatellia bacterium]|nr:hypothetical protein [Blastocatellia bacterium]